jgi:protoheme IX farnesyltransferase
LDRVVGQGSRSDFDSRGDWGRRLGYIGPPGAASGAIRSPVTEGCVQRGVDSGNDMNMSTGSTETLVGTYRDYLELLKPSITFLVLVTALAGSVLAFEQTLPWLAILHMLVGTFLCSGGASCLNQYIERDVDALMRRTQNRPLPAGRMEPSYALLYGTFVSGAGLVYLGLYSNLLVSGLAAFTILSYLFVYTPSKRTTWTSTLIGAVPGAMPPVIGWAAVRGEAGFEAWVLFGIMYLWQIPHFLAIAWMYRADYARAGFPVLPVADPEGVRTSRHISAHCLGLLALSLVPTWLGMTGKVYFFGALVLGVAFLGFGLATSVHRTNLSARRLLWASIVYHPMLLALILVDAAPTIF